MTHILNAFKMAQDAYNVTKAMRARGPRAHLLSHARLVTRIELVWKY